MNRVKVTVLQALEGVAETTDPYRNAYEYNRVLRNTALPDGFKARARVVDSDVRIEVVVCEM